MQARHRIAPQGAIARILRRAATLVAAIAALIVEPAAAAADSLTGRAMIDTRMALPPGLTFEAMIADTSRADAPAREFARTVIENPGQPPIDFSIDYDPADLEPRAIFTLRATIRQDDTLLFTTDTITRVFDGGATGPVELQLRAVGEARGAGGPAGAAHGLRLHASFRGVLPCAQCDGVRHHLDLWPDQVYHMRREWLGKPDGQNRRDEVGRWYADPRRGAIVLYGASEMPLVWEVKGPDRLRETDLSGEPIASDLPHELTSDGTLEPAELQGIFLVGTVTDLADEAIFEECLTGRVYPIARDGDYPALERAAFDARTEPGAHILIHVEGGLATRPAMEGAPRTHLVVERFNRVMPDESCPPRTSSTA
jgi:copper homeostasis protein (lipoprotein)